MRPYDPQHCINQAWWYMPVTPTGQKGPGIQHHPQLHKEFKAIPGYMRPYLKNMHTVLLDSSFFCYLKHAKVPAMISQEEAFLWLSNGIPESVPSALNGLLPVSRLAALLVDAVLPRTLTSLASVEKKSSIWSKLGFSGSIL